MQLINVKNAAFSYGGNIVVKDLNFSIEKGDYLLIVGENGSGKSTLVKGLLGLKKPHAGVIERVGLGKNEIGYLPQGMSINGDFPASVYEVVLSGRLSRLGALPFYRRCDHQAAKQSLRKLGILDLKRKKAGRLSGGQQQRVLLARALCAGEKALILDEPVSGLDPKAAAELYRQVMLINQSGVTIVMVSHDQNALDYAGKVLHIGSSSNLFLSKEKYIKTEIGQRFLRRGAQSE